MSTALKQLAIADASTAQLRNYAELTLQIDVAAIKERPALEAAISLAWPNDWIMVPMSDAEEEFVLGQDRHVKTEVQQRFQGTAGQDDPIVLVTIGSTDLPGGKDPVPLGVNGATIIVQRKLKAALPYRYFLDLKNAIRMTYEAVDVPGYPGKFDLEESEVSNYPFAAIHEMPTIEEIRDFHARTDHIVFP